MSTVSSQEFKKYVEYYLAALVKLCPNCNSLFKDSLDKMILCKECNREDKIVKILNEKS